MSISNVVERYYTVPQAAAWLAISKRTAWRLVASGKIRSALFNRCRRIPESALLEYADVNTTPSGVPGKFSTN